MKISAKTTIASVTAMAVSLIISGTILFLFIFNTLGLYEESDARHRMRSIKSVIEEDGLNNKDRAYKASLSDSPMAFFPGITWVDVCVYGDVNGKVYSWWLSEKFAGAVNAETIGGALLKSSGEDKSADGSLDEYGVFGTNGRLIIYGVAPARSPATDQNASTAGPAYILIGKLMDDSYSRMLTRFNDYSVSVVPYNSLRLTPDFKEARSVLNRGSLLHISDVDADWQNVYSLLRDSGGRPIAIIRLIDDREQTARAPYLFALTMVLLFATGLTVLFANLGVERFGLLKRIGKTGEAISQVKDSSDMSKRIRVTGRDELAELERSINNMLARLEEAHQRDDVSQQLYEKLASVTHDRVIVFNRDLNIEFINEEATAEYGETPDDIKRAEWISPVEDEQRRHDRDRLREVFKTGASVHFEEEREFNDGFRWVDTWMIPVKDKANQAIRVIVSSRDITERKLAETKTERARDFYLYLFNNFPNPVWRVDAAGRCNYVNKSAVSFTGKEERVLKGTGWESSVHPDDAADRANLLKQAAKTHSHTEIEYRLRGYDGTYRWVIDYVQPIYGPRNRFGGFYGTIVDVTERRLKADELAYMATHDVLTDTANRRRFDETLEITIAKAKRGETSSLLFIDVDDFKSINDTHGHLEGDKALRAVADTTKRVLRKEDLLARLGGDEFAVILEGQSIDAALKTAQRLAAIVVNTVKVVDCEDLTISVGVTAIGKKSIAGKIMAEADAAMYESKRRGGNRALIFEKGFIDNNY